MTEARDICLYLNPLMRMFDLYEGTDFNLSTYHLEPILHCICILWANSRYYCLSQRIVTLLKMFANTIVEQVYCNNKFMYEIIISLLCNRGYLQRSHILFKYCVLTEIYFFLATFKFNHEDNK